MADNKTWYAVYTKPRWEKKVHRMLEERGIEAYCPLNRVRRQWSDRVKTVFEPLFKSYVFVHVTQQEQTSVRFVDGIINYVYWQGKPARIKDEEIELIRKFLAEYDEVHAVPFEIRETDQVVINRGVLIGQTGKVIKVMHNSAEVILENLGYRLIAKFSVKSLDRFK